MNELGISLVSGRKVASGGQTPLVVPQSGLQTAQLSQNLYCLVVKLLNSRGSLFLEIFCVNGSYVFC